MAKFKVKKVAVFGYKDKDYPSGAIVDISEEDVERLTPCDYLEPVPEPEEPKKSQKK